MKQKFTMHIYARRNAPNVTGHLPIYVRLTVEGKRYEFSTKKFVTPKFWSSTLAEMKGKSEDACSLNNYLKVLKNRIFDHNNRIKELVGKDYAPGTLERYKTSLSHTREFMLWNYRKADIDILAIDHVFITEYEF